MTNDLINLDERTTSALTETTNVGYLTPLKKELEDLKKEIGQTDVSQNFQYELLKNTCRTKLSD